MGVWSAACLGREACARRVQGESRACDANLEIRHVGWVCSGRVLGVCWACAGRVQRLQGLGGRRVQGLAGVCWACAGRVQRLQGFGVQGLAGVCWAFGRRVLGVCWACVVLCLMHPSCLCCSALLLCWYAAMSHRLCRYELAQSEASTAFCSFVSEPWMHCKTCLASRMSPL